MATEPRQLGEQAMSEKRERSAPRGALYSMVLRRTWNDAKFRALTAAPPNGQTLFLRLLTGPELTMIPGLYCAWEAGLAQALGWELSDFRSTLAQVCRQGLAKVDWKVGVVFVPKAIKHNPPANPNVVRSWSTHWDLIPDCDLKNEAHHTIKEALRNLGPTMASTFAQGCPINPTQPWPIQEQEQEQEQEGGEARVAADAATPPDSHSRIANRSGTHRVASKVRGTRIAEDFAPSAKTVERFRAEGFDVLPIVEVFRNHFLAKTGANATKTNWDLTFTNWAIRDRDDGKLPRIQAPIVRSVPAPVTVPPTAEERQESLNLAAKLESMVFAKVVS